MKRLSLLIILGFCIMASRPVFAQAPAPKDQPVIREETRKVCDEVIRKIFEAILAVKGQYENLKDFSEENLTTNEFGLAQIFYQYELDKDQPEQKRRKPYAFAVTIVPIGHEVFGGERGLFELGFPLLKLKIAGFYSRRLLKTQYNIAPLVKEYGALLAEHEQRFLPLRVLIQPSKEEFFVNEPIEFTVRIQNVSKRGMLVEGLNADTLFFLIDGQFWGKGEEPVETDPRKIRIQQSRQRREDRKERLRKRRIERQKRKGTYRPTPVATSERGRAILRAGEGLEKSFGGQSFLTPREVEIVAIYKRDIEGVNPMNRTTIRIVEDPDRVRRR